MSTQKENHIGPIQTERYRQIYYTPITVRRLDPDPSLTTLDKHLIQGTTAGKLLHKCGKVYTNLCFGQ